MDKTRRTQTDSEHSGSLSHVPEKEFLLFHTHSIKNNLPYLICDENGPDPNIIKWIGDGLLVIIDYDALHGNKPRLKLNHLPWSDLINHNDTSDNLPGGWVSSLPLSVIGSQGQLRAHTKCQSYSTA